jgi:heptosyltransferase-2
MTAKVETSILRGGARRLLRPTARLARRGTRGILEALVWSVARFAPRPERVPRDARSILVLRNNDLGDVLVSTPLFEALRRRFPDARIAAAVGHWSLPILIGNPYVDEAVVCDAPWFNKFIPDQSRLAALRFIVASPAAARLAAARFDLGIDVLGSPWGALLLLRARIPRRLAMQGYAGGHGAATDRIAFDPDEQVGRGALRFAEYLGATELPDVRPQIFLSPAELRLGEAVWRSGGTARHGPRLLIGPGAGLEAKSWGRERFAELVHRLHPPGAGDEIEIVVAGGPADRDTGERIAAAGMRVRNLAGALSLRETFALVARADAVVANSSMLLHVAAAFARPTTVLLGPAFDSVRRHDAQWGYPGLARTLGREAGERDQVATPEEAAEAVRGSLAQAIARRTSKA